MKGDNPNNKKTSREITTNQKNTSREITICVGCGYPL